MTTNLAEAVEELTSQMSGLGQDSQSFHSPHDSSNDVTQSSGISPQDPHISGIDSDLRDRKIPRASPDEDETIKWIAGQVKGLQTAISVPLLQVVKTFEGDPSKFKQWAKDVERYAQMARLDNADIPRIVLMTCTGSVADFVKRYLDEVESKSESPDWLRLKKIMQKRFAEITDQQQAMAVLRRIKQKPEESVQLYSERLLRLAEDAYPTPFDEKMHQLVQKQLVDIFCDGLCYDYLRMKVLREDPESYEKAVEIAMKEQSLRKRFHLRSDNEYASLLAGTNPTLAGNQNFPTQFIQSNRNTGHYENFTTPVNSYQNNGLNQNIGSALKSPSFESRVIEPMDVDFSRNLMCFKCKGRGHRARDCPTQDQVNKSFIGALDDSDDDSDNDRVVSPSKVKKTVKKSENALTQPLNKRKTPAMNQNRAPRRNPVPRQGQASSEMPDWVKGAECLICHMIGHLKRNCPNRRVPDRNRVNLYTYPRPQHQWQHAPRYRQSREN